MKAARRLDWDLLGVVAVEQSFRKLARTSLRRAVGWLLLGIVLTSLVGVPVPQRKRVATDAPFPCQDHSCGCATAEACWQQCCCFSDGEKLVWARENGVTPPEHVVRAARASQPLACDQISPRIASRDPSQCGDPGCGDLKAATASRPNCCSEPSAIPEEGAIPEETVEEFVTVVLLDAYQRCRGLASIFEQLTENWTPPPVPEPDAAPSLLYLIASVDESPISRPQMPEPPVP